MVVGEQIAILYCGTHSLLHDVPLDKVEDFQENFLQIMRSNYRETVIDVLSAGKLTDEVSAIIEKVAKEVSSQFKH